MAKKRVFVSFDFDNDRALKEFILGQAKLSDSPFAVVNMSLKEAAPERDWVAKARTAISRSDAVIVMLGPKTKSARGVLKEIALAQVLKRPMFQVIGYRDGTSAWAVPGAGRVYRWDWPNLKKLLS